MFEMELMNSGSDKNLASERLGLFRKVIESLADIVDQMEIKCFDLGLSIQVMDSMHVALADVFFSRDTFSNYRCDRDVQLGIPLKHFLTILRGITVEEKSLVRFSCEDDPQVLKIQHLLPNSQYEFDITLYKIGSENYTVPAMDYDSVIRVPSDQFRTISKLIGSFGEYIKFDCKKGEINFKQTGDLIKNNMCLKSNDENVFIECKESVQLEIAMKYVNLVNKVSTLSNEITMSLGKQSPVFFEVKLNNIGQIRLYIAPKIEN
ncbi:hypothetical protein GINT2_000861 [Glugoides intestinalis]